MDDQQLSAFFKNIFCEYFPSKSRIKVSAKFKIRHSLNHSIERKGKEISIKISGAFREAPEDVLKILGLILFAKIFRIRVDAGYRRDYNSYVDQFIASKIKKTTRSPSSKYNSSGVYYDLNLVFDELNTQYFSCELPKPKLGWSLNNSYTRLGFYSTERNLLVISRIFDHKKVPANVVYYLMYHEMLHIKIPVKKENGRRIIHSAEFKSQDKLFPDYAFVQKWLKRKRILF